MMTFLYIIALSVITVTMNDWYRDNIDLLAHASFLVVGFGWLGALLMGIGFDILPLIHRVTAFDQGVLKLTIGLNISGQLAMLLAILTFDAAILRRVGLYGATLLGMQFLVVGPSAWRAFRGRVRGDDPVSGFTHTLPIFFPLIGVSAIVSWMMADSDHALVVFKAIFAEGFWSLIMMAILLGHFNRRLDWDIIPSNRTRATFLVLVFAVVAHVALTWARVSDLYVGDWTRFSYAALLALVFLFSRPDKTLRFAWFERRPHSSLILAAQMMIPYAAVLATLEAAYGEVVFFSHYGVHIMMLSALPMGFWGFAFWLHEDHCHLDIKERSSNRTMVILMVIGSLFFCWLGLMDVGLAQEVGWARPIDMIVAIFALSYPAAWWAKEAFFDPPEWHRLPMYYGTLHQEEDPYILGEE